MHNIHGEPSHHLSTPELNLHVTARGGHLAPVVFHLPGRDVSPYALAPWEPSMFPQIPPLLSVLRGDFFCLPFAGRKDGPPHGDPANAVWTLTDTNERSLCLELQATDTSAHIRKTLSTRRGQHAVFTEHGITGLDGDYNYGTHPILDLSEMAGGAAHVTTSGFHWASTFPGAFSNPDQGECQMLAEAATFTDLHAVPLARGGDTDLTRMPQNSGNDDLVMMANNPATPDQPFAWSAVVLDGYLWFSLKNPADFPATLLWISNGGRSQPPWSGRHLARLGIEEVCSYFSNGLEISRQDLLSAHGIPTTRRFHAGQATRLRMIHAVAPVPALFGAVSEIIPHDSTGVRITGDSGTEIIVPLDWNFVV